ncbi:plasmid recombination protein [Burkholderia dolosa]|nr:plasmid recombination protein [Burkholderia dolosa]
MYAILRTKKLKSRAQITRACQHNLRTRHQQNIDPERSELNQVLINTLDINIKRATDFQEKLSEHYKSLGIKEKKNNVLAFEYVATASPEFFKGKSIEFVGKWAGEQVKFMKDKFGDQLKFGILHLDEKTPHIHFFVTTELKSVKKYKNRYGECEKETWSLNSNNINPEFLQNLQSEYASNNKKYGLRRGVKGSQLRNVPMKHFYRAIDKIMRTSFKKQVEQVMEGFELSIGERLSMDKLRLKISEHILPYLNGSFRQQKAYNEFTKLDFHKLQEELIADRKKYQDSLEETAKLKVEYKEAINSKISDKNNIFGYTERMMKLEGENEKLKKELLEIKSRYEPEKIPTAQTNKKLKK